MCIVGYIVVLAVLWVAVRVVALDSLQRKKERSIRIIIHMLITECHIESKYM